MHAVAPGDDLGPGHQVETASGQKTGRRADAYSELQSGPALTTEQMRAVDRAMVEDLHIELVQMMENAGRNLAELAITRFLPIR